MTAEPVDALMPVRVAVARVDPAVPLEVLAAALAVVENVKRAVKELDAEVKAAAVEWIQANGPFTIGEQSYWVGHEKDTKCIDVPATVEALLTATGGDLARFCQCLASGAIKHGASRGVLSEGDFARLFRTTTKDVLESGERLPKKLLSANVNLLEGR